MEFKVAILHGLTCLCSLRQAPDRKYSNGPTKWKTNVRVFLGQRILLHQCTGNYLRGSTTENHLEGYNGIHAAQQPQVLSLCKRHARLHRKEHRSREVTNVLYLA